MAKQVSKKSRSWSLIIFGLIFFAVGASILAYLVLPNIWDSLRMQSWNSTQATIVSGGLHTNSSSDSTTYQAHAVYRYQVDNENFENDRVGLSSGSDNIGSFQQDLGHRIKTAYDNQQTLEIWYDPDNPSDSIIEPQIRWGQSIFLAVFGLIFASIGLFLMKLDWKSPAARVDQDHPWLENKQWRENSIRSSAKSMYKFALFFAIFWNLISSPILFIFPETYEDEGAVALIMLLFPLVGLGLIFWAITSFRQWRRFGPTPLVMDPFPGAIGGDVGGRVKVRIPYDANLVFKVTLSCLHSYTTGSGDNRSTKQKLKWQQDGYAQISRHVDGIILNFRFQVPSGLPESQPHSSDYYLWKVNFSADLKGIDFNRDFEIPVYPGNKNSSPALSLSTENRPSAVPEATLESILPVVPGSQGREIYYRYFRTPLQSLMGFIFGAIFAGVGAFIWQIAAEEGGMLYFMAAIFSLIGWLIALACLFSAITSIRLRFDGKVLTSQKKLLGIPIAQKQILYTEIKSVTIKDGMHTQKGNTHTFSYTLDAVGPKYSINLAENITSSHDKEFLQKHFEQEFFDKGVELVFD